MNDYAPGTTVWFCSPFRKPGSGVGPWANSSIVVRTRNHRVTLKGWKMTFLPEQLLAWTLRNTQ